jgi:hypothetical protein
VWQLVDDGNQPGPTEHGHTKQIGRSLWLQPHYTNWTGNIFHLLTQDIAGRPRNDASTARRRKLFCCSPTCLHLPWGPTGLLFSGYWKPSKNEADHSPPFIVDGKNAWSYTTIHLYAIMAWCSVTHTDNITLCNIAVDWLALLLALDVRIWISTSTLASWFYPDPHANVGILF